MNRYELKEYVELLDGWSLTYFMLDKMDRDVDMECPTLTPEHKLPMWEDYIEEILDWLEKNENQSDALMCIIRYSNEEKEERTYPRAMKR